LGAGLSLKCRCFAVAIKVTPFFGTYEGPW
jgi:hypothetical protein